jgi:hypothetical protein
MNYYHIKDSKKIFLFQVKKIFFHQTVYVSSFVCPSDNKKMRKEIVCINERVRQNDLLRGF